MKRILLALSLTLGILISFGQTTVTYTFSTDTSTANTLDANISFISVKNGAGTKPGVFSGELRLYQNATKGGSIIISASNGAIITNVVVNTPTTGSGNGPSGYSVDNTTEVGTFPAGGGVRTMSGLSATNYVEFYSKGTSSTTRTYISSFTVTYTLPAAGPTITVGSTNMSGFSYDEGAGPSATQTNTLAWANLTTNTYSTNTVNHFEFSIDGGVAWYGASIMNVPIPPFPVTSVSPTPVLVRLKAGLLAGTYLDTVKLSSTGATPVEVYLSGSVTAGCEELIISEYVEGSGNHKYIEIFNPTSSVINLSTYSLVLYNNGSYTINSTIVFPNVNLASGATFVVAHTTATTYSGPIGVSDAGLGFNGNDVVALRKNGVHIDVMGVLGSNAMYAENVTLTRNANIKNPTTTYNASQWTVSAIDNVSGLGSQVSDCILPTFVWTGATNQDWNTGSNWSDNIVPTATDEASIPDVSSASGNFPVITPATAVGEVTVDASASVTVLAGIILNGTFTNNGTVTLKNGAFLDDFTHVGSSFVGNIIVETTSANGVSNDQRFISSPVNTPNVSQIGDDLNGPWGAGLPGANGVAITIDDCALATTTYSSNYGNLFEFNETIINTCEKDAWVVRSSGVLENARGYSAYLANGSTFDFEGTPNTGAQSVAVTNSGSGVVLGEGWNLIGNPYPSPISRNAVITAGASDAQYYVTSGDYHGTFAPYLPSSNIAIAQGFQVHVNSNTALNFDNSFRNTGAATWFQNENWFEHKLEISVFGNNGADKTIVYFNNEATNNYEAMYDVVKFPSNPGKPTISTANNAKSLALNGLSVNDLGEIIPMNLLSGTNGNFSLRFEGKETFPANTTIYVKDLKLNTVHNIVNGDYAFTANKADLASRFEIIFVPEVKFEVVNPDCSGNTGHIALLSNTGLNNRTYDLAVNNEVIASNDLVNFYVQSEDSKNFEVSVNDMFGGVQTYNIAIVAAEKIVSDFTMPASVAVDEMFNLVNLNTQANQVVWTINGNEITDVNNLTYTFNTAGVYEVSLMLANNECSDTKTETITVSNKATGIKDAAKNHINVYPNPVKNLLFVETNENVTIELYSVLGAKIASSADKIIDMKNLNQGIYFVHILNTKNEIISINKVVKN